MDTTKTQEQLRLLVSGLEAIQTDYEKLYHQYEALEKKLVFAREQYNDLARLHSTATDTPPLSLASAAHSGKPERPLTACDILKLRNEQTAANDVRIALSTAQSVREARIGGVKIWSGPSADSAKLPSITESPMEQDFTVVGTPSKLGCPFASMATKKLSSHAASVLSRYNGTQSPRDGSVRESASLAGSNLSKVTERDAQNKSRRRSSLLDPIKAEICGLDNHDVEGPPVKPHDSQPNADVGVCPIRFLNQHSPEELATYFEKHKHELPRSHEVCVKRYQGDEQQVRELDARYGNIAQMIRGLGEKHQNYLPKEPDDDAEDVAASDQVAGQKVREWADTVQASSEAVKSQAAPVLSDDSARESHFARPLRDIRLGESPTRPWGIQVPAEVLEDSKSEASSAPVQIQDKHMVLPPHPVDPAKAGKCPFSGQAQATKVEPKEEQTKIVPQAEETTHSTIFTGPLVIGYSPEDAALFLSKLQGLKNA